MWAWRDCGTCAAPAALIGLCAADNADAPGAARNLPLKDRPLYFSGRLPARSAEEVPVPPPVHSAPIPPAALTSALIVGGIIFAGVMRRRNK
jgi:hypothetical protein